MAKIAVNAVNISTRNVHATLPADAGAPTPTVGQLWPRTKQT